MTTDTTQSPRDKAAAAFERAESALRDGFGSAVCTWERWETGPGGVAKLGHFLVPIAGQDRGVYVHASASAMRPGGWQVFAEIPAFTIGATLVQLERLYTE